MRNRQKGFSLAELMVVMVIFLLVTGAVFGLLDAAQTRYRAEQQFLESFQGARLGVEMMVRDIHNAGYPPPYTYAGNLPQPPGGPTPPPPNYPAGIWTIPNGIPGTLNVAPDALQRRFATGILGVTAGAADPNCAVNGAAPLAIPAAPLCNLPSAWDLVLELDIDPETVNPPPPLPPQPPQVEWVRYTLLRPAGAATSTLYRTVAPKIPGTNPAPALNPVNLVPFVENVVQNPGALVSAANPALFTYDCVPNEILATALGPPPVPICRAEYVQNVYITLQVRSTRQDIQTRQFRRISVQGAARRLNPSR